MAVIAQEAAPKPYESVLEKQERPVTEKEGTVYALLVGYNIFGRDPVYVAEYSRNDVQAMRKRLQEDGIPPENIVRMTDEQKEFYLRPTRSNILAMANGMAFHAKKNDTLLVMLAGIGAQVEDETCYLPMGTTTASDKDWITESEIVKILVDSRAHETVLIGLFDRLPNRNVSRTDIVREEIPKPVEGKIHVTLNSCSAGGFAEESAEAKNDLFLATLLAISKERKMNLLQNLPTLFPSANEAVRQKTAEREGGPQVPQMRLLKSPEKRQLFSL